MRKKKYKDIEIGDVYGKLTILYKGKYENYHQYWWCKCDCGKVKQIQDSGLKAGNVISCGCAKIENLKKVCNNRLQKTLKQWCEENHRLDVLELWDYELNSDLPENIAFTTKKKYYFKCRNKNINHTSELKRIDNFTMGQENSLDCDQCESFAQWGLDNLGDDFLEKYWDYDKNKINPFNIPHAWNNKVWIKCQEHEYHGSYEVSCNNFIYGKRCSYCQHTYGKIHKFDSVGYLYPEIVELWSDKNKLSPYDYSTNSNQKVYFKCPDGLHDDFLKQIQWMVISGFRCTQCSKMRSESFLQEATRTYIEQKGYKVNTEWDCSIVPRNPKTGRTMPFDNEVIDLKLIIEVHGEQHYNPKCTWHKRIAKRNGTSPLFEFKQRKLYDRYKKAVAECNGYFYLEIPYWNEKDESYKTLIDNKIREIKIKQHKAS